jgi:methylated-DNA-[protein]-cysteine S-methyltransferase
MADELRALVFEVGAQADPPGAGWGWLAAVASVGGLRMLTLPTATRENALRYVRRQYAEVRLVSDDPFLLSVAAQVQDYLAGRREEFSVELDLKGHTAFELAVWATTRRIVYGETRTYGWIAGQIGGGPGTAQAVGAALGDNPIPLIIPCHRVIGSDGSLHGFAGGLDMKARLLALENQQLSFALD